MHKNHSSELKGKQNMFLIRNKQYKYSARKMRERVVNAFGVKRDDNTNIHSLRAISVIFASASTLYEVTLPTISCNHDACELS